MPSSIPYDHPSLVLGNIVDVKLLNLLKKIGNIQIKVDAAQEKMNSYIMMKRSLAMTINELTDMNVDVAGLKIKIKDLDTSITQAATDYMSARMEGETGIQQLREQISLVDSDDMMESPIDFTLSSITRLPLSAESLKLDVQYFSYGSNQEDDTVASIEKYIKESTSNLGGSKSGDIAKAATAQINQQRQNHSLAGTLIITASCTHRNVAIFEPLVIDADKAISVWNSLYPDDQDRIKTSDPAVVKAMSEDESQANNEKNITLLSGITYGSSFVGMVHILKTDTSGTGLLNEDTAQLQEKLRLGGWLENASGGFGVDSSVMDEVKKMLSTQSVNSHVSMIVMGAVPSIASSQLKLGVSKLIQPDPTKLNTYLSTLAQSSSTKNVTVESGANEARTGNRILSLESGNIQSIMQGLGNIDHGSNNVIDINSMMTGFENYLQAIKSKDESVGAPINFYLKRITKQQLAKNWMDKYYPEKDNTVNTTNTTQKKDDT